MRDSDSYFCICCGFVNVVCAEVNKVELFILFRSDFSTYFSFSISLYEHEYIRDMMWLIHTNYVLYAGPSCYGYIIQVL